MLLSPAMRLSALVEHITQKGPRPSTAVIVVIVIVITSLVTLPIVTLWPVAALAFCTFQEFVQFAAIQPYAATLRAVVDLDPLLISHG